MTSRTTTSRTLRTIAAVAVASLIAAACGGDDTAVPEPTITTPPTTTTQPRVTPETTDALPATTTSTPLTEEEIVEMQEEIAEVVEEASPEDVPPAEIVEQVMEAVEEAAPESELNLGICTQWVTDPELVLNEQQTQECAAMLAAAVETCEGLDCFPEETAEPEPEVTTTTTTTPEPEPEVTTTTTTTTPPEPELPPTTTAPPEPEDDGFYAAMSTATLALNTLTRQASKEWDADRFVEACSLADEARAVADAHEAAFGSQRLSENDVWLQWIDVLNNWGAACLEALAVSEPEPEPEPELTDYEVFAAAVLQGQVWTGLDTPPVHPDTQRPSWERGTYVWGERPDDRPRVTEDVQDWIDWCGSYRICDEMLFHAVWPLDYLGANAQCVLTNYQNRVIEINQSGVGDDARSHLRDQYGWHRCASVIDPVQPDGRLLSEHGLTVAERCSAVLPADVKLEFWVRIGRDYELRDDTGCDEWAAWVEDRGVLYKECDKSARLAEEWLEHYIDRPERFRTLSC